MLITSGCTDGNILKRIKEKQLRYNWSQKDTVLEIVQSSEVIRHTETTTQVNENENSDVKPTEEKHFLLGYATRHFRNYQ